MIQISDKIPKFLATHETGALISQEFFLDKTCVLFFYPRDDTPGCTIEAKDFSSHKNQFLSLGIDVFGISQDNQQSHEKFKKKHQLSLNLLYDHDEEMCKAFQVLKEKKMYGKVFQGIERSTFLITKGGKIVKIWRKVKVEGHVEEVLNAAKTL